MNSQQPLKEPLCGLSVPPLLEKYIHHFTVLINGSPQIMLLSLDLHEYLINEESITILDVFVLIYSQIEVQTYCTTIE